MRSCLVCDDHALVRDAMVTMLRQKWPKAHIHEAADFPTAWTIAQAEKPELCVVDLMMPGADERAGMAGLCSAAPDAKILILTGSQDDDVMMDLLDMGVAGFASKTLNTQIITAAIELVLAGGSYLPPRIAEMTRREARRIPSQVPETVTGVRSILSPRQIQVVGLMAEGLSNKEIGRALNLSPATVKTHVAHVIALVGGANRTDAAMKARGRGLI